MSTEFALHTLNWFDSCFRIQEYYKLIIISMHIYDGLCSHSFTTSDLYALQNGKESPKVDSRLFTLINEHAFFKNAALFVILYNSSFDDIDIDYIVFNFLGSSLIHDQVDPKTRDINLYICEKCLSIIYDKVNHGKHARSTKIQHFSQQAIAKIMGIYLSGIVANLNDVFYSYKNSFCTFLDILVDLGYESESFYFILTKILNSMKYHRSFNQESLKSFSLLIPFVSRFGVKLLFEEYPQFLDIMAYNFGNQKCGMRIIHHYAHLCQYISFKDSVNERDIYEWLFTWLSPILTLNFTNNHASLLYSLNPICKSLVTVMSRLKPYQNVQKSLIKIFDVEKFYPNILIFYSLVQSKLNKIELGNDSILDKMKKYLFFHDEQISIECLKILCTFEKDDYQNAQHLLTFLKYKPISQQQYIRESILKVCSDCFKGYYTSKTITLIQFKNIFKQLFQEYLLFSYRGYYGRSFIGWKMLELMFKIAIDNRNSPKSEIIKNHFSKPNHIYYFIERLSGTYDHEQNISLLILETLLSQNPNFFNSHILKNIFNHGLEQQKHLRVENEHVFSLVMKFISGIHVDNIYKIFNCSDSSVTDSKTFILKFLLDYLDEQYKKLDYLSSETFTLHSTLSAIRLVFDSLSQSSKILLWSNIYDKVKFYLHLLMDVVKHMSPEGFSIEEVIKLPKEFEQISKHSYKQRLDISNALMNCIWRFTRESFTLLCDIAVFLIGLTKKSIETTERDTIFGSIDNIELILETIITQSHHVGIYEMGIEIFGRYAKSAWEVRHLAERLKCSLLNIPDLLRIKGDEQTPAIISTRRSAGLPYYVEVLINNAPSNPKQSLVSQFIEKVKSILNDTSNDYGIKSKVICLNITRHLFNSSRISKYLHEHINDLFSFVVTGVSSKIWPIKNASILLFSVLVKHVFGDTPQNEYKTTFTHFLKYYPILYHEINNTLINISEIGLQTKDYHILTCFLLIIKRIAPFNKQNLNSLGENFLKSFDKLASCPNYKIRRLSVDCFFTFYDINLSNDYIRIYSSQIHNASKTTNFNYTQTCLMLIDAILNRMIENSLENSIDIHYFETWNKILFEKSGNGSNSLFDHFLSCQLLYLIFKKIVKIKRTDEIEDILRKIFDKIRYLSTFSTNEEDKKFYINTTIKHIERFSECMLILEAYLLPTLNRKYYLMAIDAIKQIDFPKLDKDIDSKCLRMMKTIYNSVLECSDKVLQVKTLYFLLKMFEHIKPEVMAFNLDNTFEIFELVSNCLKCVNFRSKMEDYISTLGNICSLLFKNSEYLTNYEIFKNYTPHIALITVMNCSAEFSEETRLKSVKIIKNILLWTQEYEEDLGNVVQVNILFSCMFYCIILLLFDECADIRKEIFSITSEFIHNLKSEESSCIAEYKIFGSVINLFYDKIATFIFYILTLDDIYSLFEDSLSVFYSYIKFLLHTDLKIDTVSSFERSELFNDALFRSEQRINGYFDPITFLTIISNSFVYQRSSAENLFHNKTNQDVIRYSKNYIDSASIIPLVCTLKNLLDLKTENNVAFICQEMHEIILIVKKCRNLIWIAIDQHAHKNTANKELIIDVFYILLDHIKFIPFIKEDVDFIISALKIM